MDELDRLKSEIDLTEYAVGRGYQRDRRASGCHSVVMRHPLSDDKVVISRAPDLHWIYFSVRDQNDHGTIIDFVCRRDHCSVSDAARELRHWVGAARASGIPTFYNPTVTPRVVNRASARAEYESARGVGNSAYLNSRGIRPSTIAAPRFIGTMREDAAGRILFPHADEIGFAGFESKHHGWTSFSPGGVKALWSSNQLSSDSRLVLVESAIDALSHYQLYPDSNTRYASTAGRMSPHQCAVLGAALKTLPEGATVVLAFDRDQGGDLLVDQVRTFYAGALQRHTSPVGKDWNDCLRDREHEFIAALSGRRAPCHSR